MAEGLTEDQVRDKARGILGFEDRPGVVSGVGQLTTFNRLGFKGVADKPDGWYLPDNVNDPAVVLETKASRIVLKKDQVDELLKNIRILIGSRIWAIRCFIRRFIRFCRNGLRVPQPKHED